MSDMALSSLQDAMRNKEHAMLHDLQNGCKGRKERAQHAPSHCLVYMACRQALAQQLCGSQAVPCS